MPHQHLPPIGIRDPLRKVHAEPSGAFLCGVEDVDVRRGESAGEEGSLEGCGVAGVHESEEGSEGGRRGDAKWDDGEGDVESGLDPVRRWGGGALVITTGKNGEVGTV